MFQVMLQNERHFSNDLTNHSLTHTLSPFPLCNSFSLGLAIFLAALDQTIIATSLYRIGTDFNALNKIAWVATSYLLTATAFQPTYGKFSDIFGRKITFLFAILIFELGSLLCGLAPNMVIRGCGKRQIIFHLYLISNLACFSKFAFKMRRR